MSLTLQDRAVAAILAGAAGDALGWPQEPRGGLAGGRAARRARKPQPIFTDWVRNGGNRYQRYGDVVRAGSYSDDTQLILAVARACLSDDWVRHLTRIELPSWPVYQRGGGRAVLTAARSWTSKRPPWKSERLVAAYRNAGANGVAMRILPHVIVDLASSRTSTSEMHHRVFLDGITTHGHPRALVGAAAHASTLRFALSVGDTVEGQELLAPLTDVPTGAEVADWLPQGWLQESSNQGFVESWDETVKELHGLCSIVGRSLSRGSLSNVDDTMEAIGAKAPETNGSGTVSAVAAAYLAARSGSRPIGAVLDAAFTEGSDTDTIASMTGSIVGALHGASWLEGLEEVQDASYLKEIAHRLVQGAMYEPAVERSNPTQLQRNLEDTDTTSGLFVDGRRYEVLSRRVLSDRPYVMRAELALQDGQTVVVDYLHKLVPDRQPVWWTPGAGSAEESRENTRLTAPMSIPLSPSQRSQLESAALRRGMSVEQFILDASLQEAARRSS